MRTKNKKKTVKIQSLEPMVLMSASAIDADVDVVDTNGTVVNSGASDGITVEDGVDRFTLINRSVGVIDPGEGEQGAAIFVSNGDTLGETVRGRIINQGELTGRGQAGPAGPDAGDGLRFLSGAGAETTFAGSIINTGTITSESNQGPTAAIRFSDNVGFDGALINFRSGVIAGANNGLYFGNAEHDAFALNFGTISSDSRAVNIDGTGVTFVNVGQVLGTGDQRNGTIYSDATADEFSILNSRTGVIDAGPSNDGAGIALQTGDTAGDVVDADVINRGRIAGRGQAAATGGTAGDGVRIFAGAEGGTTFDGNLINSGQITSESTQGATSAVRIADGVGFDGNIQNGRGAVIAGANNGLYFGDAEHDARVLNFGTISSDSRAVNIDGTGVDFVNRGVVLGTGDQRNGTIYSDATADDFSIVNNRRALIDAGAGNNGAGVALQTGETAGDVVNANITNRGNIVGRGQAAATGGTAGDGVRIFAGAEGETTFNGNLINRGRITSESSQGPTSGVRVANGVGFEGTIRNDRGGVISGANNGLYFGVAEHDANVFNSGTIASDSRAINIDGSGVDFVNSGRVVGTGDQRNGTIYADATADEYSIVNSRRGLIDAGRGNDGSGVSLQTGDVDGDVVNASVRNDGTIRGRGDAAEGNTIGDGVRVFGSGNDNVTFQGDIVNNGRIFASGSDEAAGIRIEDEITVDGQIVNNGSIAAGQTAIDASDAGGDVDAVNRGFLSGDVVLGSGDDSFDNSRGFIRGDISGGAGNDTFIAGRSSETFLYGNADGNDTISNFSVNRDSIDVSAAGIQSFQDLQIANVNGNAVISFANTSITLQGVAASQLDARDFVFADEGAIGADSIQAFGEIFALQNTADDDAN